MEGFWEDNYENLGLFMQVVRKKCAVGYWREAPALPPLSTRFYRRGLADGRKLDRVGVWLVMWPPWTNTPSHSFERLV